LCRLAIYGPVRGGLELGRSTGGLNLEGIEAVSYALQSGLSLDSLVCILAVLILLLLF